MNCDNKKEASKGVAKSSQNYPKLSNSNRLNKLVKEGRIEHKGSKRGGRVAVKVIVYATILLRSAKSLMQIVFNCCQLK